MGERTYKTRQRIDGEGTDLATNRCRIDTCFSNMAYILFMKSLYQVLWCFTIIGGFIKYYEYSLIPYILAENPKINKKEACDILSKVGLCALEYIDREVNKSLSGGELKRIEIATVLARKPRIAIFDEPEAGIDLWSFRNLNKIFKQISDDNNSMTLVISHQEKILNMADKVILMENGNIVNFDSCENVMNSIISKPCCKKEEIYNG